MNQPHRFNPAIDSHLKTPKVFFRAFLVGAMVGVMALSACASTRVQRHCISIPGKLGAPLTQWSAPFHLPGVPPGRTLRWPSVTARGDTFFVAANLFPIEPLQPLDHRPLIIFSISGRRVAPPPGDFQFAFPKAAVDSRGTYHLIWAEPDSLITDMRRWPGGPLVGLWYAAHDGESWSAPQKLLASSRIALGAEGGVLTTDDKDGLHAVVPANGPVGRPLLMYLRKIGPAWEAREVPAAAAYASVLAWGSDSIVVAYTAPDSTAARDGNSVFVVRSDDRGSNWGTPTLISRSSARDATAPIVVAADRRLYLVWGRRASGGIGVTALTGATSADGGTSWTEIPSVELGDPALRFHVAASGAQVEAIVEDFDGDQLGLRDVQWNEAGISVQRFAAEFHIAANAGFIAPKGISFLIWTGVPTIGDSASTFAAFRWRGGTDECRVQSEL